ncbi:hypothetical protein CK203_048566 [Vitis vinifera]|uniref:Uncharacterized protein n=1 Tax=Vitis vinifera TaxID=29760 RepID=A0A438HKD4_VITVI|nr:hypothetical protein CK203_048566 [Vitis vinifera]
MAALPSGCEHPGGKCAAAECKWRQPGAMAAAGCNGGNRVQWRQPGANPTGYVVRMPSDGVSGRPVRGFRVKERHDVGLEFSHLFFANDNLIFCDASLKINLEKNELIPIGDVHNREEFAEILGYKVGTLPTTYLGLPLGAFYKFSRV